VQCEVAYGCWNRITLLSGTYERSCAIKIIHKKMVKCSELIRAPYAPYVTHVHGRSQLNGYLAYFRGPEFKQRLGVGCSDILHGCAQSLQANTLIVSLPDTVFPIGYSLNVLSLEASLNREIRRSANIAPCSTSQLHTPCLQLWKEPLIFMVQEASRYPDTTWTQPLSYRRSTTGQAAPSH
jgi:hypothetical protein